MSTPRGLVGIVARRELVARLRDRVFIGSTLFLLLIVAGSVLLPLLLTDDEAPRYTVAVTGSAAEEALTRRVSDAAPGSLELGGKTNLSSLIALVARASILVSNDTGPAHLAYALKTPSVTLFGPSTDAERWGPLFSDQHAVLRGNPISDISVENVLRSAEALTVERERVGA